MVMSDRDPGDARAFEQLPGSKYDLNRWNETYWDPPERVWNYEVGIVERLGM